MAIELPASPSELGHIFRKDTGHVSDTPANRLLLLAVANDPAAKQSEDQHGCMWSSRILADGRQVWTKVRNDKIINAGINDQNRPLYGKVRIER